MAFLSGFSKKSKTGQTGATFWNYLAKVGVEGSSPFARSRFSRTPSKVEKCPLVHARLRAAQSRAPNTHGWQLFSQSAKRSEGGATQFVVITAAREISLNLLSVCQSRAARASHTNGM